MVNRQDLATFLLSRRRRLQPPDVGLPEVGRRRTPGLRRQEVAHLAGMSVDYYVRLEQARGPRPSRQILAALARALMLTADEREYLFRVAGESPPPQASPSRTVSPGIRNLIDSLPDTPAYVVDAKYDILAWNTLATHFIGAAYARYPADPGIGGLVTELLGSSPRFAEIWAEHDVESRRPLVKRVDHPWAGALEFECLVLHIPDTGQRLITYCAAPGSPTQAAFRRLAQRRGARVG